MPCFYPVPGWRAKKPTANGKYPVVFSAREADLDARLDVPCGKCEGCRADRAQQWSVRLRDESLMHPQNSFVTLTYADSNQTTLDKSHLQKFIKNARSDGYKFRYFAVGEYGEQTRRPHYHAIIFGEDFRFGAIPISETAYTNRRLEKIWNRGIIYIDDVTPASCAYVAGYVHKKLGDTETFSLMSTKPGIGHAYLDKFHDDLRRVGASVVSGKERPVPKRYLKWKQEELQNLIEQRAELFRCESIQEKMIRMGYLKNKEINKKSARFLKEKQL